ncbi:MAG TPA: hypothetical protein VLV18_00310 [Terriglobales bacterium]|nr:hypothetical protein [Terriglobales bacterium]
MEHRVYERLFLASAVALFAFVILLNCLQGTPFIGGLACPYQLTSSSIIIKIGATAIFALFLGLLFGPILAAILHPKTTHKTTTTTPT